MRGTEPDVANLSATGRAPARKRCTGTWLQRTAPVYVHTRQPSSKWIAETQARKLCITEFEKRNLCDRIVNAIGARMKEIDR
jgi:hypothetical protein